MRLILQNNEQDCLLACLAMVLSAKGIKILPQQLLPEEQLPPDGLSLSDLKKLGKKWSIEVRGYKDPALQLLSPEKSNKDVFPLIAHWRGNHFVVVSKVTKTNIYISDPAIGHLRLDRIQFAQSFGGVWVSVKTNGTTTYPPETAGPGVIKPFANHNLFWLLIALVVGQTASLLIAWTLQQLSETDNLIAFGITLLLAITFVYFLSALLLSRAQASMTREFEKGYSNCLFESLLAKPFLFFKHYTIGGLLELVSIRGSIRDIILNNAIPSLVSFLIVLALIVYSMCISWILTLIICLLSALFMIVSLAAIHNEQYASVEYMQKQVSFSSMMQQDFANIVETKALHGEGSLYDKWIKNNVKLSNAFVGTLKAQNVTSLTRNVYYAAMMVVIGAYSVYAYRTGSFSVSTILVFQVMAGMIANAINSLQTFFVAITKASAFESKQKSIFRRSTASARTTSCEKCTPHGIVLEARKLSFSYPGRPENVSLENLRMHVGEKIAILGESGSGKSTLLYMLLGLVSSKGYVAYSTEHLIDTTGIVLTDMSLKQGTLRENLCDGCQKEDRILWAVLRDVGLESLVSSLPSGLESSVLEGGSNFSSGQSQRILLARSLLRGSNLVVWDEALSRLDEHTRNSIYENIVGGDNYSNVAMLIVSHHTDITPFVDRLIFVDSRSHKAYLGTHEELFSEVPQYRHYRKLAF